MDPDTYANLMFSCINFDRSNGVEHGDKFGRNEHNISDRNERRKRPRWVWVVQSFN